MTRRRRAAFFRPSRPGSAPAKAGRTAGRRVLAAAVIPLCLKQQVGSQFFPCRALRGHLDFLVKDQVFFRYNLEQVIDDPLVKCARIAA